jgi:hypothetical protein
MAASRRSSSPLAVVFEARDPSRAFFLIDSFLRGECV